MIYIVSCLWYHDTYRKQFSLYKIVIYANFYVQYPKPSKFEIDAQIYNAFTSNNDTHNKLYNIIHMHILEG
jgi:hypothetical protein